MRKYRLVAKKGEGTFSEVLKAQNVKDGKYHAIKCMKNRFDSIDQVNNLREIQALRRLSPHEHIITLEEVLYDQPTGRLALVFELMDANLYELIRGRRHYLNPQLIKSYLWQLMKSLDHMHKKGIFHRDIKPENILIESTTEVVKGLKLADFGSCRGIYSKQPYTEYISTRWYRAPECLLTDGYYGPEMDLWGAGCVMFEITSLYPLFPGSNEVDQISRIHKVLGTPPPEVLNKLKGKGASHINFDFPAQKGIGIPQLVPHAAPEAIDLMVKLLKYDAAERITAREAMRHPYFKDVRESEAKQQGETKVAAASTMPSSGASVSGSVATTQSVQSTANANATPTSTKPLPNIVNDTKSMGASIGSGQEQYIMMQKQQQNNQMKATNANAGNTASSLPPINGGTGTLNQQKLPDPKAGRTLLPSSNGTMASTNTSNNNSTQKKRKKYRMNYAQQQRVAQNSESVMKAYGVPKIFGNMETPTAKSDASGYVRYDGSKLGTGMSGVSNVSTGASSGLGGGGTFGQYRK